MPAHKTVTTLQTMCIGYVANNIDSLCVDHGKLKKLDQRLFDSIPTLLPGNVACLNHLLNHNHHLFIVRIPFWPTIELDMSNLLNKIGEQGEGLVELRIHAFIADAFVSDVVSTLSRLPRLQRLTLKLVVVSGDLVTALTQHCTQLTEVTLSGSCLTEDCLDLFSTCTNIEVLIINCVIADPDATAARSLQVLALPRLRIFRCDILTQALRLLDLSIRLSLTEYVEMNQRNLQPINALSHVLHVCPMLTTLCLHLFGNEDVEGIELLIHLRELSLYLWPRGSGIAFMIEFQLVLRAIGGNLRVLRLWFANLDFTSITTHCTALEELEVCHINWIRNFDGRQLAPLTRLQTFKLSLTLYPFIKSPVPGLILSAFRTKLKRIELEKCHLSDHQFDLLLNTGRLDDLVVMRLSSVCCLSIHSLGRLMARRGGALKLLHVFLCGRISEEDIDGLRGMIRALNLDVTLLTDYLEFSFL